MYQESMLVSIARGPTHRGFNAQQVIPNEVHPSDHLPIWADFEISTPLQVAQCCAESYLKCLLHARRSVPRRPLTGFELERGFDFFDMNSSGKVNRRELRNAVTELGVAKNEDEIDEVMSILLPSGSKKDKLTIDDFKRTFYNAHAKAMEQANEPLRVELQEAFSLFDIDGNGKISKGELLDILTSCSPVGVDEQAAQAIVDMVDTDGSSDIDLDEFVHACCLSMRAFTQQS